MNFNAKQAEALDPNIIDKNVLISAGAGSGKTAVLTEKVFNLITKDGVNVDELLVLTFTDAASFGMKEKIIKRTRGSNPELANKLYSAHIQTFDSFTSFLVKKYADRLNINPNFKIIDESIIAAKKEDFIEEILEKYYLQKDPTLIKTLELLCFKTDRNLKDLIKKLDKFLNALSTKDYNEFVDNYDKFLDPKYIESKYVSVLNDTYENILKLGKHFTLGNFEMDDKAKEGFDEVLNVINNIKSSKDIGWDNFYNYIVEFKAPLNKNSNKFKKLTIESRCAYDLLIEYLKGRKAIFSLYPSPGEEIARFVNNKDVHHFLINIYKELKAKIDEYKFVSSSYTFQDISLITLKLISDPKFEDIQEEISNTFKYCLVDEYQDTNDIQEEFLNFINKKSKLFVVGDIKQSIYKFRNANPSLFKDRKIKYNKNLNDNKVIDMNTNYRSLKKVLDDSNTFFEKNMSLEKGDVTFNDEEKLHYDMDSNLYDENQLIKGNHYGLNVLSGYIFQKDAKFNTASTAYEEILIIIDDILDKINNKYQVLDKNVDGKLIFRDCNFGDFAILCKRKSSFGLYKDLFTKYNIPLNIVVDENVRDINSVITLESLINFYLDVKNSKDCNPKKLRFDFTSIARSYLFEMDDESIFNILNDTENKGLKESVIYLKMKDFVKNHKDESISQIFNALINEFNVFTKLNSIGEIDNNLNKIETIYSMIKSLEDGGKTIEDFGNLLSSFTKHKIELQGRNLVKNDNCVELTTIHASKGLEYKIVYLSCFDSNFKYHADSSNNFITKDNGILLDEHKLNANKTSFFKKTYLEKDEKDEYSEYIRLIYVALTRAKENLYFVNPFLYSSNKESELSTLIKNAFTLNIKFNKELFDEINKVVDSNALESDIKSFVSYYNALFNEKCLKNSDLLRIVNDFSFKDFLDSLNNSLVARTKVASFKDKLNSKINDSKIKKIDELNVNESSINELRDFAKEILKSISLRLSGFYIISKLSDEIFIEEFDKFVEPQYRNYFVNKLKKVLSNGRTKFNDEDLLLFIKLTQDKEYSPLFENYFADQNIQIKNLSFDKEIKPFNRFKVELPRLNISIEEIEFKNKKFIKASHSVEDPEIYKSGILKEGIKLHKLLELSDFKSKDTSFIKDSKDRMKIDKVLNLDIFKDLKDAYIFKEYEYLEDDQKGIIDLLIIKGNEALIIDYKTKNIDENKYKDQLDTYKRNVERIFNIHNIKTYLISINDGDIKEVY